jgi:hypothetical protein
MPRIATLGLCAATIAVAACGGGDSTDSSTTTTTTTTKPPGPPPKETRDPLPNRPHEWKRYVNDRGGFALLLPRGWNPNTRGTSTLIRSFDRLVAISIVADRSRAGLETPIADYARSTAKSLRGFNHPPRILGSRPFKHRYEAVEASGAARSAGGIDQRVSVIALRRDDLVTITAVLAANAKRAARHSERIGRRVIETVRSRPPQSRSGRSG